MQTYFDYLEKVWKRVMSGKCKEDLFGCFLALLKCNKFLLSGRDLWQWNQCTNVNYSGKRVFFEWSENKPSKTQVKIRSQNLF